MKGGVRILAGELRGRRLAVPPSARPTAARVREALFDVWGDRVRGARFLELFAGTGAVGLEAVSRGAAEVVLVESNRRALEMLRDSCARLAPDRARVVAARLPLQAARLAEVAEGGFDLIFADPPYDLQDSSALVTLTADFLVANGQMVLEHAERSDPGEVCGGLRRVARRRYGDHRLSYFESSSRVATR